jgi:hypothetical protein
VQQIVLRCSETLTALLLTGLLLPALLAALTRILGLLARLLLTALLATLIRVVLVLLTLVAFVRHVRLLVDPCPVSQRRSEDRRSAVRDTKD